MRAAAAADGAPRAAAWLVLAALLTGPGCADEGPAPIGATVLWTTPIDSAGTSSPRVADLNGDGVREVVLGAGREQQMGSITVLSGTGGQVVWQRQYHDEVYASPVLMDVDGDGLDDVVCGRRKRGGGLQALSGTNGAVLWGLRAVNPDADLPDTHFNSPVPCPDLDDDGVDDLVCLQGGGQDQTRPPGRLHLVSGRSGALLATLVMPDGRESYQVPSLDVLDRPPDGRRIVIGTGGETVPGHLMSLTFPGLEERWRVPSRAKGWVAAARLHDFAGHGVRDVVAVSFDGQVVRVDGETGRIVWQRDHDGFETYVTPGLGRFDGREGLDVVVALSKGTWPVYAEHAVIAWLDGETGELLEEQRFGVMATNQPLVLDVDGDGWDEVLIATNLGFGPVRATIDARLVVFDGRTRRPRMDVPFHGFIATTPWLGDLDDDGRLDVVAASWGALSRLALDLPSDVYVRWNQYRGPRLDGVVARERLAPDE